MAQKPDIQYVRQFYTPGSEARKVELKLVPRKTEKVHKPLPKPVQEKKLRILIDPVAMGGVVIAAVLLVLMAVGIWQFHGVCQHYDQVEQYVSRLEQENKTLTEQYREGYDLEKVRETAAAIGMVPREDAKTFSAEVTVPQAEPEPTFWEELMWFLKGLFA